VCLDTYLALYPLIAKPFPNAYKFAHAVVMGINPSFLQKYGVAAHNDSFLIPLLKVCRYSKTGTMSFF
jgi:hypothetical protein